MSNSTLETSAPVMEFTGSESPASSRESTPEAASSERAPVSRPASAPFRASDLPQDDFARDEFSYRPVPVIAPVSFFLGISAVIGLFGVIGLGIGLAGTILGLLAILQIRRSAGEMSGMWMAVSGFGLASFFLIAGTTLHTVAYATEVPEGFERVNFTRDISKKGFVYEDGAATIHPDVRELDGKKVFLKGYMYPERQIHGIQRFVFVKDNGQCCFGGQPQMTDMILVEMEAGKAVDFSPFLVSVAGVFHARSPDTASGLSTVYKLDASFFSPAKTSF